MGSADVRRAAAAAAMLALAWGTLPGAGAMAQPAGTGSGAPTNAADLDERLVEEFAALHARWLQETGTELRIALGEQLLALEPKLTRWPLPQERKTARRDIAFNLGFQYNARLQGVRADNIEKAIALFESVLAGTDRGTEAEVWGQAQNNLAIAYWNRIRGERSDNQERAIAHFEAALTVFTREAYPEAWGQAQNNLAAVYWNRVRGVRGDNLELAIIHFRAALQVLSREKNALLWAQAQNNLANAYGSRLAGNREENLENAIALLQGALTVFTRESYPQLYAEAHNNLAIAYMGRVQGVRGDNVNKAIESFEAVLTVFTRQGSPYLWAHAQNNIGVAFAERPDGDPAQNREKSRAAWMQALTVFTREGAPREHMRLSRLLGGSYSEDGNWTKAGEAYAAGRETFLLLFGEGLSDVEARDLIDKAGPIFAEGAYAAIQRGEAEKAFELASEGKARMTAVALKLQTLELSAAERQRVEELRDGIRAASQLEETTQGAARAEALEKLISQRRELLALVSRAGAVAAGKGGGSALAQARAAAGAGGAIAVPVLTRYGSRLLLATAKTLKVVDLPELTLDRLLVLMRGDMKDGVPGGWLGAYNINYLPSPQFEEQWPKWLAAIGNLGGELWQVLGKPLSAALQREGIKPGARLIWLPSGALGILPLGLALDPARKQRLAETYEITYALSVQALSSARTLVGGAGGGGSLAIVINPTGDLGGSEKEGAFVTSYFAETARAVLEGKAATSEAVLGALKGKAYWHFASHGTFAWGDALDSALIMYDHDPLSVRRLLETSGLGRPRLVVLSACETGLYDIARNPDEFIGLPGAFTALGAAGVLGTLWPVADDVTALLIGKFYELHLGQKLPPVTALARAQAWMRTATNEDLEGYAKSAVAQGRLPRRHLEEIEKSLSTEGLRRSRNAGLIEWIKQPAPPTAPGRQTRSATPGKTLARPYAHPYFWAGFVYTGL